MSTQHVYDFAALDRIPDGPTSAQVAAKRLLSGPTLQTGKSSTVGAVLTGSRLIVTLGRQARGSGAKAHTHPNEQFNYILQGTMTGDISGELVFAQSDTLMHTPAQAVHTGMACPDEDLVFLAVKDTRHGIVGPPVDGKYDGPNFLPGFGTRAGERMQTTAGMISESKTDPYGVKTRYIYDFRQLAEKPGRTPSARVTPQVSGAPGSGVTGALVTGEKLHVALLRYPRGGGAKVHANPNEQFVFVVEGLLRVEIAGTAMRVEQHCIAHIPAATPYLLSADGGDALVVTAQDNAHAFLA